MAALNITVGGRWLSLDCNFGDVQMSTEWPGCSGELSWVPAASPIRYRGGEAVEGLFGGVSVWSGTLLEPDPSQDRMTAQGLWHLGDKYPALNAAATAATAVPDTAINNAIGRGLPWTLPSSISVVGAAIDLTQGPATVNGILDAYAENNGVRWGVNANGEAYATADPTTPTYQTLPLEDSLGYALDAYASTLICRYLDSATSTYKTLPAVTDATAEALHGHVEALVDLTPKGAITAAVATNIANSILTLGRSTPQWMSSIAVTFGELLAMGGAPVALETVAAGSVVRVHGGFELAQRQNGLGYIDVLIGRTDLAGGILTLQPMQVAPRNFTDVVTAALEKK